jgi:hypothetical protein
MDIVETLRQPLSMSMFRNANDLFAEMAGQRKLAADEITDLRARCASLEAERDTVAHAIMAERERCAQVSYRTCAETRHVKLGQACAAAIRGDQP